LKDLLADLRNVLNIGSGLARLSVWRVQGAETEGKRKEEREKSIGQGSGQRLGARDQGLPVLQCGGPKGQKQKKKEKSEEKRVKGRDRNRGERII
jgi:hypothetical protein